MVVDTTMDSMYLENLDEFINDEGKIVTYKWLSLSLKVHVNVAKQMLYHYVSKQRNADKGDDLNVTYMVSGVAAGDDRQPEMQKTMLVREENLATAKSKMKDVISVHIYSVAKSKVKDLNALYTANYNEVKKNLASINRYSGIECSCANVKSADDLKKLQQENAYHTPAEPAPSHKKAPPVKTAVKNEPVKEEENAGKESSISKQGKKSNNQIASMFARQSVKTEVKEEKKEKETNKPSSAGSKKKGGISAFFNKGAATATKIQTPDSSKSSPVKTESVEDSASSESPKLLGTESEVSSSPAMTESLISSIKTESQDSNNFDSQRESVEVKSESPKKSKTKAKTQSKIKPGKASQKRGKSKHSDDESPIPKRKRIMAMSDSDSSSDEENEEEEESPFPASPVPEAVRIESDEEEIPSTPQPEPKGEQLSSNGRPKKRKLVSKTFMDDDGFFVTKKEYEYVSDSEEETAQSNQENIPARRNVNSPKKSADKSPQKTPQKKATKPSPKKASKDVNKTKQSSIMSFFGKK